MECSIRRAHTPFFIDQVSNRPRRNSFHGKLTEVFADRFDFQRPRAVSMQHVINVEPILISTKVTDSTPLLNDVDNASIKKYNVLALFIIAFFMVFIFQGCM